MIAAALFLAGFAPGSDPEAEGQKVMLPYAECILRRDRRAVEAYLNAPVDTEEARRLTPGVTTYQCLGDGDVTMLRIPHNIMRGALFEVLYKKDYRGKALPTTFAGVPQVAYTLADPATMSEQAKRLLLVNRFADCVVRAAPAEARALIASPVASIAQKDAVDGLQPALGACLQAGSELRFSRSALRGIVAESLYRLTAAAQGVRSAAK